MGTGTLGSSTFRLLTSQSSCKLRATTQPDLSPFCANNHDPSFSRPFTVSGAPDCTTCTTTLSALGLARRFVARVTVALQDVCAESFADGFVAFASVVSPYSKKVTTWPAVVF